MWYSASSFSNYIFINLYQIRGIVKIFCWFPSIIFVVIPFPFHMVFNFPIHSPFAQCTFHNPCAQGSTHSPLLLEGRRHQIDVELTATPTNTDWTIYCFDRIFRFNVFQLFRESNIYASVYLVGGSGRAIGNTESDFTYTVTVKGPSDAQTSNTWQTQDDETVIANHIPERCFSIPSDRLQYFVRYGDVLRFHVELNLRIV